MKKRMYSRLRDVYREAAKGRSRVWDGTEFQKANDNINREAKGDHRRGY
jgi:hypothetical protein